MENPEGSYIWLYGPVKRLLQLDKVRLIAGDQCQFMGEFVKPTGWLTNAEFPQVLQRRCPGRPTHKHEPLMGFTLDFYGNEVFKTALAAEYPQGLCIELAKGYVEAVKKAGPRQVTWVQKFEEDVKDKDLCSKKAHRERENEQCVGGLRNPWQAINKLPHWKTVGRLVWRTLQASLGQLDEFRNLATWVGFERDMSQKHELDWVRSRIGHTLCCQTQETGLWGNLLERLVDSSQDPDVEVATWPNKGTPLGILNEIPPGGVFPKVEEGLDCEEDERMNSLEELDGALNNYKSYDEAKSAADELFRKELEKGFVQRAERREDLEVHYGPLVPSAIGYIAKIKFDGSVKGRLAHDLRRSQVNEHIELQERLLLPSTTFVGE